MELNAGYLVAGHWNRIPLSCHWTILLWVPWYWWESKSLVWALVTLVAFTALLFAHEVGHAVAARSRRIDVYAIKVYVLHGLCEHDEAYYEKDDVLVAWGGVLAQVFILSLAVGIRLALRAYDPMTEYLLYHVFFVFINANIAMAIINLIPVAPLDGKKAWRVIPLLNAAWRPKISRRVQSLRDWLNFKRRREMARQSEKAASELLERLRKK